MSHRQSKHYTLTEARELLRQHGIILKKSYDDGIVVNYRGGREGTAYHAYDDLEDAVATGLSMAKNFVKCAWKECPTVEWCTRCKSCKKHCKEYGCG